MAIGALYLANVPKHLIFTEWAKSYTSRARRRPKERFICDAGATVSTKEEALDAPFPTSFFNSVDVHDAVEESPKENVGEQSAEQSRGEESGSATQEAVPGVHGAKDQHEPERQSRGEVEEEAPQAGQP